jgi:hypothetical protein
VLEKPQKNPLGSQNAATLLLSVLQSIAIISSLQVRIELQVFAAHHVISSAQLARLLKCLRTETDRGTTMAALWGRVVDRVGIYDAWQELSFDEQRQVRECSHFLET